MSRILPILSLLLLLPAGIAVADPADYFHRGVQHYVHAREDAARAVVQEGLRLFPDDPLLTRLAVLVEERPPPPPQSSPDESDPSNGEEETDPADSQDGEEDQETEAADPVGEPRPTDPADAPETAPDPMTPEQAQRLLETARNDERRWSEVERNRLPRNPQPSGKTW